MLFLLLICRARVLLFNYRPPRWAVGAFGHLSAPLCTLRCRANSKGCPTPHPEDILSARLSLALAAPGTFPFTACGRQTSKSRANSRSGLIVVYLFDFNAYFSLFNAKTRTFLIFVRFLIVPRETFLICCLTFRCSSGLMPQRAILKSEQNNCDF